MSCQRTVKTCSTEHRKVNLSSLYEKIEAQLRALESLGVTKEKYAAILFPLVESCLPAEILSAWKRYIGDILQLNQADIAFLSIKIIITTVLYLLERVNINVALFSYMRAFGNGPRNFEPWSSDVDDT
ncbi:hypothetical protein TNCV_4302591 [Trichonephila clavipes]|nr:hypothetical protein TNCV_4302591 [Trichonephila clavipes]